MKTAICASLLALFPTLAAPAALADDDDRRSARNYGINQYEALEIAGDFGLYSIKEIKFSGGKWEIEGCTSDGQEIEIDISARSGDIIKLEYEDDDDCW
jgi:uncharacterized membrane protein YkoI